MRRNSRSVAHEPLCHSTLTMREAAARPARREEGHILPAENSRYESDQGNLITSSNLCDEFLSTARKR